MSRRRFVQASGVAITAGTLIGLDGPAQGAAATAGELARDFARPASAVRPKFRWWWPHGLVDPAEIRREVDRIADAGFGGAEIADVHHSVTQPMDPAGHGWGTPAWVAAVTAALSQAGRRGITIDLTIGPAWPAAVPTITPDSPAAMKELAHGAVAVPAGEAFDGPVPAPAVAPAGAAHDQRLLAVQAVRTDPANTTRKETGLDAGSVTDLTAMVSGGRLGWTAPGDGDWLVIAYWLRGSGQQPESGPHTDPPSYVVDHLSPAGTAAVTGFWEKRILNPSLRKLIREAGGALFEDSIELETDATLWTPDLPAEFEKRAGYDLLPYLPTVVKQNENTVYAFEAGLTARLRRDLSRVLSALINEHHFGALRTWAHSIGLELRAQPYGLETDAISSAAILDIPEGESLGFHNLDDYRCLAGGRDMGGRRILSNELGAYAGGAYNTAWDKVLKTLGGEYAAGVNQTVLHGFSYAEAPGAAWPGFAAFTPYNGSVGYAESWGPRQPTWRHIEDISGYLGRTQAILQAGTPRIDVAYVWQSGYGKTGLGAQWFTSDGGSYVSLAHGWATGPTPALTFSVLGIAPDGTGGRTFHFVPHPADLSFAQGRITTTYGPVNASWRVDHGSYSARLTAPKGTTGRAGIPLFGGRVKVYVNGRQAWDGSRGTVYGAHADADYVYLEGLRGDTYTITTKRLGSK
jgi:hypothetical protein